jgi:glycosyltransferase involved in cell wall biosynthesis
VRLALDVRTVTARGSGVGNYVRHLLAGLRRVGPQHDLHLIHAPGNLAALGEDPCPDLYLGTRFGQESHPLGDLWEHLVLPRRLNARAVQVLHGPCVIVPLGPTPFAKVATVHDLVPMLFPETVPKKYALYMTWLLKRVARATDRIIAVSQQTKRDLVENLGVEPAKVAVVHEAAQPEFRPVEDQEAIAAALARHGVSRPFFLHAGNLEPRKNQARLVRAFLSRPELRERFQLVLAGAQGWLTTDIERELASLTSPAAAGEVLRLGYVPLKELVLLMNAAQAFVFPSLYEGFGLPVLEAMSCATPVITSNIGSLPEIAGQAALLVDPLDPGALAEAMLALAQDGGLRARLAREGLARAANFTWDEAARATLAVYQEAAREKAKR